MRSKTYKEKGLQINMYGGRDITFALYVKKDFFGVEGAKAIRSTVEGVIDEWFDETKLYKPDFLVRMVDLGKNNDITDAERVGVCVKTESKQGSKNAYSYQQERWQKRFSVDIAVCLRNIEEGARVPANVKNDFLELKELIINSVKRI